MYWKPVSEPHMGPHVILTSEEVERIRVALSQVEDDTVTERIMRKIKHAQACHPSFGMPTS